MSDTVWKEYVRLNNVWWRLYNLYSDKPNDVTVERELRETQLLLIKLARQV